MKLKLALVLLCITMSVTLLTLSVFAADTDTSEEAVQAEVTYVAEIGENKYETLFLAVEAAEPGDTIKLLDDFVIAEADAIYANVCHIPENSILDLNGYTLRIYDARAMFAGKNITIQNGTIASPTDAKIRYPLYIGNAVNATDDRIETSVTIKDIIVDGGINIRYGAEATLDNVTASGVGKYYAVYTATDTKLTVLGGTYTGGTNKIDLYASSGSDITVYGGTFKYGIKEEYLPEASELVKDESGNYVVKLSLFDSFGISLNKGITVRVKVTITSGFINDNPGAKISFSNGTERTALAGTNTYTTSLTPGQINDALTAEVKLEGGTAVASLDVSFASYKAKVFAAAETGKLGLTDEQYEALTLLLEEIQDYADAADRNGTETEGFDSYVVDISVSDTYGIFAGFTAILSDSATINIGISETAELSKYIVTVSLGGKELISDALEKQINISGLYPTHFNDEIVITVFELSDDGTSEAVASAAFTFNSCLKALYNCEGISNDVKQMAVAAYNYGKAVENYKSKQ